MPHSTSPRDLQAEIDDILIQQALDPENTIDFNRELEPGEKAEDAIDFGDLSDDDLADDECETLPIERNGPTTESSFEDLPSRTPNQALQECVNYENNEGDGFDDLFGDNGSSQIEDAEDAQRPSVLTSTVAMELSVGGHDGRLFQEHSSSRRDLPLPKVPAPQDPLVFTKPIYQPATSNAQDKAISKEQQLQQDLFAMSAYGLSGVDYLPPPPQNQEELLKSLWPKYERTQVPRFMELLPPKKTPYAKKTPPKRPKSFQPTKLNLDLAKDLEKSFRLPIASSRPNHEVHEQSCVIIDPDFAASEEIGVGPEDMDIDPDSEITKDITWQDLYFVCQDWDGPERELPQSDKPGMNEVEEDKSSAQDYGIRTTNGLDLHQSKVVTQPPQTNISDCSQKRKLCEPKTDPLGTVEILLSSLHDPIHDTFRVAEAVTLDMNDSLLLTQDESHDTNYRHQRAILSLKPSARGSHAKGLNQRYNVSNDEAYDLLKANHQSKVRSTLGTLTVEHSLPAVRLQWPYYKTRLQKQEARSFHRPAIKFQRNEQIAFRKPRIIKRKHLKGKDTQSIFESTKDLSLGDNSHMLLLEYSEEYPTMLSNFGMGSRLINYYRRKNMEDISRPKLDVGETAVLLPQDKSPFSVFGHIDPGQMTPAVYNSMFKAPVFRQEAKPTDFVVVRNTTGLDGPSWYIRSAENLHVVGQEFPSVDVPGPHSRKVTTAAKNRLKMVSYRQIRRKPIHRISVAEVTKHFTDTTDMQNRQKMKEFMQFSKEHKEWEMRPGEAIPDEEMVRSLVKPEDVCLLESMQVGQQHLLDAGFTKADDDSDEDDGKEGRSIEQQLAPWFTSRNFIHAAQGKAMLQLHGEGDPSGRGEAFSFIKTSMKGGFKAMGESVEDKLDAKKLKELGGHSYNVARQQKSYEESIRRIWDAQRRSLSSTVVHSDVDLDEENPQEADHTHARSGTPRPELHNPPSFRRPDDETTSQYSKLSTDSQAGKVLRITRYVRDEDGQLSRREDVIDDVRVIRQYLKRRHAREAENITLSELKPTGDAEQDRRNQQRLEKELARLQRNKERRIARDKQKGLNPDGPIDSPNSPTSPVTASTSKPAGTQRKCANCGQVGHIKTNKNLIPFLYYVMAQRPKIPERLSSLLPAAWQQRLDEIKARRVSGSSNLTTASDFLEEQIRTLSSDLDYVRAYRTGLHKVSDRIPKRDLDEEVHEIEQVEDDRKKSLVVFERQRKIIEEDLAEEAAKILPPEPTTPEKTTAQATQYTTPEKPDQPVPREVIKQAFANSIVGRVMAASSRQKKSKFVQASFRRSVEEFYGAVKYGEKGEKLAVHCAVTGWQEPSLVKAAHIVPKSLKSDELAYLFGAGEIMLKDPRNGLILHSNIEEALDSGKIVIVPIPSGRHENTKWKLLITNSTSRKEMAFRMLSSDPTEIRPITWGDLDGQELSFLNDNRPARRYLYFRYIISYLTARKEGNEEWTGDLEIRGTLWASPGKYLRKSLLRVLAKEVSDTVLPESLTEQTTFEEVVRNSPRSPEEEETLGQSLAIRLQDEAQESQSRRDLKKRKEEDEDLSETEDDDSE